MLTAILLPFIYQVIPSGLLFETTSLILCREVGYGGWNRAFANLIHG